MKYKGQKEKVKVKLSVTKDRPNLFRRDAAEKLNIIAVNHVTGEAKKSLNRSATRAPDAIQ